MLGGTVAGMLVWMPINPGGACRAICLRNRVSPIAALGHISRVAEALHQHGPGARDADGVPAGRGRLSRKPVARQRRDDDIESVLCLATVGSRDR